MQNHPGIPQDLLLIQDFVGTVEPQAKSTVSKPIKKDDEDYEIASSDNEDDLDEQAVEKLIVDSDSDSSPLSPDVSSSESESDSDELVPKSGTLNLKNFDVDEDEENGITVPNGTYFSTKNEVAEAQITIPDITQVPAEDELEKVGKIINIMGNTVIVEGLAAQILNRGLDRALDCETLLVFEDRQVFGYIYETFGPTHQPLYQVKFNTTYPLDPQKVQENRVVFHVPRKSRFVFLSQIKQFKGSDASNVNDEEPAPDELEFSDDEAEAAHKQQMKRSRRAGSVASLRHGTPVSSHDDDMSGNPYAERDIYDMDRAGPSRPPPIPYDDPYAEEYLPYDNINVSGTPNPQQNNKQPAALRPQRSSRGRGRGNRGDRPPRGRRERSERTPRINRDQHIGDYQTYEQVAASNTTQYPQQGGYQNHEYAAWGQPQFGFAPPVFQSQQSVQPHINPRFASALGFDFWSQNGMQQSAYGTSGEQQSGSWADGWDPNAGSAPLHPHHEGS